MPQEKIIFDHSIPKTLHIRLRGDWQIAAGLPALSEITTQLSGHEAIGRITFDTSGVLKWDSGLVSLLLKLIRDCERKNIVVERQGLPQGAQKLLALALTMNEKVKPHLRLRENFFAQIGNKIICGVKGMALFFDFLGEIIVGFKRFITGKSYFRRNDFILIIQRCGADALFLVSLISMLVGMIFAFVGAIQLKLFGAQIFIADIVGIAMVRVMGAVMTGVIMSGRTGAAFAAELGIMQMNEEIDALKTLGVSPVDFLVIPRVLALVIMLPLLTIYADFMGIIGGFIVSVSMFHLNPIEYMSHIHEAVKLNNFWVGLVHSFVFGIIVSVTGCLRGMQCERNSASVGEATTSAVVSGITAITIATAIITFICQVLGV